MTRIPLEFGSFGELSGATDVRLDSVTGMLEPPAPEHEAYSGLSPGPLNWGSAFMTSTLNSLTGRLAVGTRGLYFGFTGRLWRQVN